MRANRRGFLRNIACALGNSKDPAAIPALTHMLDHEKEPLVRQHATWALGQLDLKETRSKLERLLKSEQDDLVLAEIKAALDREEAAS